MRNLYGWTMSAVLCVTGIAVAQVREEPRAAGQPRPGTPGAQVAPGRAAAMQHGTSDQQIAAFLHGGAQNEVELARFAQEHAKSDDVKEFAANMIKDHSEQVDRLARLAGNLVAARDTGREGRRVEARRVDPDTREGATETRRDADTRRDESRAGGRADAGGAERTAGMQGQLNWNTVHKEISQQCLKSTKEELGRFKGDDFDKAYMGQQIVAHMEMHDKLKVMHNHASGQLKQQIQQDMETVEHHLQEARKIMEKQKDQGSEGTSGRTERGSRERSTRQ